MGLFEKRIHVVLIKCPNTSHFNFHRHPRQNQNKHPLTPQIQMQKERARQMKRLDVRRTENDFFFAKTKLNEQKQR